MQNDKKLYCVVQTGEEKREYFDDFLTCKVWCCLFIDAKQSMLDLEDDILKSDKYSFEFGQGDVYITHAEYNPEIQLCNEITYCGEEITVTLDLPYMLVGGLPDSVFYGYYNIMAETGKYVNVELKNLEKINSNKFIITFSVTPDNIRG